MAEFLLETYVSRAVPEVVERDADRAMTVVATMRQAGRTIDLIRTIFVPQEETCFFVYEAASADDVREAARLAGLQWDRVTESVTRPARPDADGDAAGG